MKREGTVHDLKTSKIMQCTLLSFGFLLFNIQLVHAQEAQVDTTNFYDYFRRCKEWRICAVKSSN